MRYGLGEFGQGERERSSRSKRPIGGPTTLHPRADPVLTRSDARQVLGIGHTKLREAIGRQHLTTDRIETGKASADLLGWLVRQRL
jgi:hypothetical protein